jgi:hypothetical protein
VGSNRTISNLNAPFQKPDDAKIEEVEVTDPDHPLFGKSFPVLSVSRGTSDSSHVFVRYRDGIMLRIARRSTNLSTLGNNAPRSKLTAHALRDLFTLVKEYESCLPRRRKSGNSSRRKSGKKSSKN